MDHSSVLKPEQLGVQVRPIGQCGARVGVVSYLNTKPLVFGLRSLAPALDVRVAPPSQLAQWLRQGELDVALVPVLEYFSREDYGLIRESAICGDGHVRSVLLFSRVPIDQVTSICLDPESLTTNALIRVLCRHHYRIDPRWLERPAGSEAASLLESGQCDAAVVIGNAALAMTSRFPHAYDFGQEWWHMTRLPFVFAVWAVRPGADIGDLPAVLHESLRLGLSHLDVIAADAAQSLGLDRDLVRAYLGRMIRYRLTERAWQGMARFFVFCAQLGICPSRPPRDLAAFVSRVER